MTESVRLGRIFGVDVGINWSVLVIFALISVGLAAGRFPEIHPDREPAAYLAAGLGAGILFFASLLAHELSHAVVARRNDVPVDGITLWIFGGVARLAGEPSTPGADLRVAGVGPLVSVVLGALFGTMAVALDATAAPERLTAVFAWLAVINIVLAVFNLVPAAPLDGGRILRAALWRATGDRNRAAVSAARAGRGLGWVLVALGLFAFVAGDGLGGLWFVLIGWFITNSAAAEQAHVEVTKSLRGVMVGDVMTPDPSVVSADISVRDFIQGHVFAHRHSTFPVVDAHGRLVGLVTLGQVKRVPEDQRGHVTVSSVACGLDDVPVLTPTAPLSEAVTAATSCSEGRVLVVDGERLVGIVSPSDILHRIEIAEFDRARSLSHA